MDVYIILYILEWMYILYCIYWSGCIYLHRPKHAYVGMLAQSTLNVCSHTYDHLSLMYTYTLYVLCGDGCVSCVIAMFTIDKITN